MKNWFVANYKGELIASDVSEIKAKTIAQEMQEKEPNEEWEAIEEEKNV